MRGFCWCYVVNSTHSLCHYERLKSRFNLLMCCTKRNVKKNLCQTHIIKNCRQLRSCKTRRHVELSQTCAVVGEQAPLPQQIHTMTKICWWYRHEQTWNSSRSTEFIRILSASFEISPHLPWKKHFNIFWQPRVVSRYLSLQKLLWKMHNQLTVFLTLYLWFKVCWFSNFYSGSLLASDLAFLL